MTELLARFLVQRARRVPQEALEASETRAALAAPALDQRGRRDPLDALVTREAQELQDLQTLACKPLRGRSAAYLRSTCFNPSPNLHGRRHLGRRTQTSPTLSTLPATSLRGNVLSSLPILP